MSIHWKGVFPAVTTQLDANLAIDLEMTRRTVDNLVRDGIDGVIALGTVGENNSFEFDEKIRVLTAIVEAVAGRVPVLTGVSEYDTRRATRYAQAAEKAGADGLMLLPCLIVLPCLRCISGPQRPPSHPPQAEPGRRMPGPRPSRA